MIFYSFLNKIFDRSEDDINTYLLQYLSDLWNSKQLGRNGFQDGLSKFLAIVPNISADYPKLSTQLAKVMHLLYKENAVKFDKLILNDKLGGSPDDDDQPIVEDYYKLMAQFLQLISSDFKGPDPLLTFFKSCFDNQFKQMKPLILEEGIFDEIEESIGGQRGQVIRAILEQDSDKY